MQNKSFQNFTHLLFMSNFIPLNHNLQVPALMVKILYTNHQFEYNYCFTVEYEVNKILFLKFFFLPLPMYIGISITFPHAVWFVINQQAAILMQDI